MKEKENGDRNLCDLLSAELAKASTLGRPKPCSSFGDTICLVVVPAFSTNGVGADLARATRKDRIERQG